LLLSKAEPSQSISENSTVEIGAGENLFDLPRTPLTAVNTLFSRQNLKRVL
jgi:hypothetical protein